MEGGRMDLEGQSLGVCEAKCPGSEAAAWWPTKSPKAQHAQGCAAAVMAASLPQPTLRIQWGCTTAGARQHANARAWTPPARPHLRCVEVLAAAGHPHETLAGVLEVGPDLIIKKAGLLSI
jgi:hypothetical protein